MLFYGNGSDSYVLMTAFEISLAHDLAPLQAQAQALATCSNGFTEFLKGWHLIFASIKTRHEKFIDLNIKKCG
jgi:hypothetical protein